MLPHSAVAVSCAVQAPRAKSRRARELSLVDAFRSAGYHVCLLCKTASPSLIVVWMRADLAALPPEIRSNATKSLPCRLPTAARAPLDDDAHRPARTMCADLTAFSNISRSRTPSGDLCGFGMFAFSASSQSGLPPPARC